MPLQQTHQPEKDDHKQTQAQQPRCTQTQASKDYRSKHKPIDIGGGGDSPQAL